MSCVAKSAAELIGICALVIVKNAAKLAVYIDMMIRLKNHHVALMILPLVATGDPLKSARKRVPHTYQKLSRKSDLKLIFESLVIRVTANKNNPMIINERNIAIHTTLDNRERNWNGQTLRYGFFTTTLVPLVMNGLVKSTTSLLSGVILNGASAISAL